MFLAITAAAFAITMAPPVEMMPTTAQMDHSVEIIEPVAQLQRDCAAAAELPSRQAYFRGFYIQATDRIYLPSDWPSKREFEAIRVHEHAHRMFGWTHP